MPVKSRPMEFKVQIETEPDGDLFHAYCRALKGLHVSGTTEKEAIENAKDAAIAYLTSVIKHGDPIPIGVIDEKATERRCGLVWFGALPRPRLKRTRRHIEDVELAVP